MCLAIPAQIRNLSDDHTAQAEYQGNILTIEMGLVDAKPGDFVLVHAGCAIEWIDQATATELSGLLEEIAYADR
jgi:hydrogenase expression/formation protein HypC